jgi:hypothetical protein
MTSIFLHSPIAMGQPTTAASIGLVGLGMRLVPGFRKPESRNYQDLSSKCRGLIAGLANDRTAQGWSDTRVATE